jgi:hypothetical protein
MAYTTLGQENADTGQENADIGREKRRQAAEEARALEEEERAVEEARAKRDASSKAREVGWLRPLALLALPRRCVPR